MIAVSELAVSSNSVAELKLYLGSFGITPEEFTPQLPCPALLSSLLCTHPIHMGPVSCYFRQVLVKVTQCQVSRHFICQVSIHQVSSPAVEVNLVRL